MTDDDPFDEIPSLYFLVDQAAENLRQANHHTHSPREVTDLSPVLGAMRALFSRSDQLITYLAATVAQADAADYDHDAGDDLALTLADIDEDLAAVRDHAAQATRAIDHAWTHLAHLAPAPRELACPQCGEPAFPGVPIDLTPTQRGAAVRPRHRHADGTQLCPVIGDHGYEAATPVRPDPVDPTRPDPADDACPSRSCTDPQ